MPCLRARNIAPVPEREKNEIRIPIPKDFESIGGACTDYQKRPLKKRYGADKPIFVAL
jgi:hypothetical protein